MQASDADKQQIPGLTKPKRFRPKFHYELLLCGVRGHELLGMDAREVTAEDQLVVRERDGVRWHRCLRCDSWIPLAPPQDPKREKPPTRDEVELPLRGKPLRDQVILRVIAVFKGFKFVLLAVCAILIFILAGNRHQIKDFLFKVLNGVQGTTGATDFQSAPHWVQKINHILSLQTTNLRWFALAVAIYAAVFGIEAVGLWLTKRWAEYFAVVATSALIPVELYELYKGVTPLKILALIINVAVVVYLLVAKRLFGLRGGASVEHAQMERDVSWEALERTAPPAGTVA